MTQHGRHRAPKSHAQPKLGKVSATTAFVAGAAVLLTGGITAAANSSEPEPIFVNSRALIIDSTVTYDVRDHVISESEITEDQEIEFPVEVIKDKNIAEKPIKEIMGKPYPIVKKMTTLEDVSKLITNENDADIISAI